MGSATAVADFIDSLIAEVKSVDPGRLCTFGNFPPTEFLRPRLPVSSAGTSTSTRRVPSNYLARLQMLADTRPLVLGNSGWIRSAKPRPAGGGAGVADRGGLPGRLRRGHLLSFTDDWFRMGGRLRTGPLAWSRRPRPQTRLRRRAAPIRDGPGSPTPSPKVSVVVASYNGAATLRTCLQSLEALEYPDYEVILVDDGSTDTTPEIAANSRRSASSGMVQPGPRRGAQHGHCRGGRRNHCLHWLRLSGRRGLALLFGPETSSIPLPALADNFLPPDDATTAACVMVSPAAPPT